MTDQVANCFPSGPQVPLRSGLADEDTDLEVQIAEEGHGVRQTEEWLRRNRNFPMKSESVVIVKITNPAADTEVHVSFEENLPMPALPPMPRLPRPVNHFPGAPGPDLQSLVYQGGRPVVLTPEQRAAQSQPAPVPTQPIPPAPAPCSPAGSEPPLTPPPPFTPGVAPV